MSEEIKISGYDAALALDGTELIEVVQTGANKKVTINDLLPVQLQGDKTIGLNGHAFMINPTADPFLNSFLFLDATPGAEIAFLQALNTTGDGNYGSFEADGANISADAKVYAVFNSGSGQEASIELHVDASSRTIEYDADTHTFNGAIIIPNIIPLDFANDAAAAVGLVPVGGLYHSSGTLKIRLT